LVHHNTGCGVEAARRQPHVTGTQVITCSRIACPREARNRVGCECVVVGVRGDGSQGSTLIPQGGVTQDGAAIAVVDAVSDDQAGVGSQNHRRGRVIERQTALGQRGPIQEPVRVAGARRVVSKTQRGWKLLVKYAHCQRHGLRTRPSGCLAPTPPRRGARLRLGEPGLPRTATGRPRQLSGSPR
jgi:hypothetical protein